MYTVVYHIYIQISSLIFDVNKNKGIGFVIPIVLEGTYIWLFIYCYVYWTTYLISIFPERDIDIFFQGQAFPPQSIHTYRNAVAITTCSLYWFSLLTCWTKLLAQSLERTASVLFLTNNLLVQFRQRLAAAGGNFFFISYRVKVVELGYLFKFVFSHTGMNFSSCGFEQKDRSKKQRVMIPLNIKLYSVISVATVLSLVSLQRWVNLFIIDTRIKTGETV